MANAIHKRFREKNTAHPSLKVKIRITVNGIDDWRINITLTFHNIMTPCL